MCQCATTGLGTEVREPPPANPHRPRHAQQTTLPSRGQRTRWTVYTKATVYSLGVPVSPTNTPGWMSTNLQPARLPGGSSLGVGRNPRHGSASVGVGVRSQTSVVSPLDPQHMQQVPVKRSQTGEQ